MITYTTYIDYAYLAGTAVLVFERLACDVLDAGSNHASAHVPVWWSRALLHCETTCTDQHNAARKQPDEGACVPLAGFPKRAQHTLLANVGLISTGIHECTEAGLGQPKMPRFDRSAFLRASLVSTWNQRQRLCEAEQSSCKLDASSVARLAACMRLHCSQIKLRDDIKHFQDGSQVA